MFITQAPEGKNPNPKCIKNYQSAYTCKMMYNIDPQFANSNKKQKLKNFKELKKRGNNF